jgi:hypothetical protein
VWFVVTLPVFLEASLGWRFWQVGGFMGLWVIGYGNMAASLADAALIRLAEIND